MSYFPKIFTSLASLAFLVYSAEPAKAFFSIQGSTAGSASIFAQGGLLDYDGQNNPYFMMGIEATSDGVFITQGNSLPEAASRRPNTRTRLLKVTGFGQTERVGSVLKGGVSQMLGNDLTQGPENKLYVATDQGIWGFDPQGGSLTRYSQWFHDGRWLTSSGLTFDQNGNRALVSTDYAGLVYVNKGDVEPSPSITTGASSTVFDDHIVTNDGIYVFAYGSLSVRKYASNGELRLTYNLTTDQDVAPVLGSGIGARASVDPISGDIFYAISYRQQSSYYIIRIKKDFTDATVFATGLEQIRDLDFGPSSSKYGSGMTSLYVAVNDRTTFQGTIYEIPMGQSSTTNQKMSAELASVESSAVPEPTTIVGMAIGLNVLFFRRKKARRQLPR